MAQEPPEPAELRVICNPISGERIVIRQSSEETGGQLLVFDLFLPPGGHVPAAHVHPHQEERFTVVSGRMQFRLGRRTIVACPGETVVVSAGTTHWFGNAGDGMARSQVEVRPALRMEALLEKSGMLGASKQGRGVFMARVSDLVLLLLEFHRELAIPHLPASAVRWLLLPFGWLAERRSGSVTR